MIIREGSEKLLQEMVKQKVRTHIEIFTYENGRLSLMQKFLSALRCVMFTLPYAQTVSGHLRCQQTFSDMNGI